MITLRQILSETIWVAKMDGWRVAGTYNQMKRYAEDENCRDFDIAADQPAKLKMFYKEYFDYGRTHGFITVQDFYMKHYALKKEETHLPKGWIKRSDGTHKLYGRTVDGDLLTVTVYDRGTEDERWETKVHK